MAITSHELEILKYLMDHGLEWHSEKDLLFEDAVKYGSVEIVDYLVDQGVDPHTQEDVALFWASSCARLEMLRYLAGQGLDMAERAEELCVGSSSLVQNWFRQFMVKHEYVALCQSLEDPSIQRSTPRV